MSMNVSVTFFIEALQPGVLGASAAVGWSESWYGTAPGNTFDEVYQDRDVQNYIPIRRGALPEMYRMSFIRIAEVGDTPKRRVKVFSLNNAYGTIVTTPGYGEPAQVQCALLVDLVRVSSGADPNNHRRFLMRGLPMGLIRGNVIRPAGGAWANVLAFLNFIGNKDAGGSVPGGIHATWLGCRYLNPNPGWIALPLVKNNSGDGRYIRVMGSLSGGVGSQYRIKGCNQFISSQSLNRTWTVAGVVSSPEPYVLLGKTKRPFDANVDSILYQPPGTGQLRLLSYLYSPFSQYTIIGLRSKKTGRVFRQLLGRSRRRT